MTNIIIGFVNFINNMINNTPSLGSELEAVTSSVGVYVNNALDFIYSANFIVPISDIFAILSIIFILRSSEIILFVVNWVIKRIFDVIP